VIRALKSARSMDRRALASGSSSASGKVLGLAEG
jgi:hypothetical protein